MTRKELDTHIEKRYSECRKRSQGLSYGSFYDGYFDCYCEQQKRIEKLEQQIEKMKEVILELLNFEGNLDPYMYECDSAQNGELLKPFTNARELLKDCICKKCKGDGIVRVGYNGWDKNPCPICKGRGYVIRSN